ncbi:MAG TPA: hypothetical protein DDW31_05485 [candidate division Zixibacteria bacterium]|nr:hypothetical protein [candidate division Zixibacteria bacterium]
MRKKLPRIDKTAISVARLRDDGDEKEYWLSRTAAERLNAIEQQRRMIYGEDRTASRLQRLLEVAELPRR